MSFILNLFNKFGLTIIFFLILLEYGCFPLPSEVVLPFAGFIANRNAFNLIGVIILSIIMGYLGCLICYVIGYYGGSKIYNKIYNKLPSWQKGLNATHNFFYKYGNISVMVGRVIPMFRTYVSFFAGIFKQSLLKYSIYSIIGISIWNTILITLGYVLVSKWTIVVNYYNNYKFLFCGAVIISIIIFLLYKMYKKGKNNQNINGD